MTSSKKEQSLVERIDPERSEPTMKHIALPDNHPVHFLPEARSHYQGSHAAGVPFLFKRRSEVIKTVVLSNSNGTRPKHEEAIEAKIVAKPWDKDYMFWTLDHNNTRHIVKPSPGGAQGGMRYLCWAGPSIGFHQKPLALSFISPSRPGATSAKTRDVIPVDGFPFIPGNGKRNIWTNEPEWLDPPDTSASANTSTSSDTSDSDDEKKSICTPSLTQSVADASETKTFKQTFAFRSPPAKRRKVEVEDDSLYCATPRVRRRSNARASSEDYQSGATQPTISASKTPVDIREAKRKRRVIAQIEKELNRQFDEIFTPWAGEDQDVSRNTLQTILQVIRLMKESSPQMISQALNKALNGGDGKRQSAGGRKPTKLYFNELATSLRNLTPVSVGDEPETCSSSSRSNRQYFHSRSLEGPEAESAIIVRPNPRSSSLEDNRHQVDRNLGMEIPPLVVLPPYKQARTSLIVRVAPSLEYITLRLGECKTTPAFYDKVLGAWEIDRENAAKITVTFSWMAPEDPMRRMAINGRMESYFADLLEQVDEAPCWAEAPEGKGKCVLDVDIVLKE